MRLKEVLTVRRRSALRWEHLLAFSWRDLGVMVLILLSAMSICLTIRLFDSSEIYVSVIYVLAVFLVSRFTRGYLFGVLASFIGVLMINYIFTYPYFDFNFTLPSYPVTIICTLAVSIITSTMTTQIKQRNDLLLASEKEKMRGNLLRAISHDLRTPLTSILGASSAILESGDALTDAERTRLLRGVQEDAQWLIAVVENLLSVTRIDSEGASLHKVPEPVEEVASAAVAKFKKRFPGYAVRVSVPDELLMPGMDALLIEQVLINLLENTVFHAPGATQRSLSVSRQGDDAVFCVADNGPGIPLEQLRHILDGTAPHPETPQSDGRRHMGIGLSVCSSIVRAHGGTMTAQNAPAGGAVFTFTLPLGQDREDDIHGEPAYHSSH